MKTILLLEDDENLNRGITLMLSKEGYQVCTAFSLKDTKEIWQKSAIDMVISDISLPDGNGLDFGREIRKSSDVYLIYLTALDQEIDMINGYETGADDYITKPFSINALISKVNALMRRLAEKSASILQSGELEVSLLDMQVKVGGEIIALSRTEMQLLVYLLENARQIVSKESILDKVWGMDGLFVDEGAVTVNISRLKSKLKTESIANVRGLGYLWTDEVIKK